MGRVGHLPTALAGLGYGVRSLGEVEKLIPISESVRGMNGAEAANFEGAVIARLRRRLGPISGIDGEAYPHSPPTWGAAMSSVTTA